MNRNYVYAFPSVRETCNVVNYSGDSTVNTFLWQFDVWRSHVLFKLCEDHNQQEVWFECSKEFFEMLHTDTMKRAFKSMGVELVFEYPFMDEFEK